MKIKTIPYNGQEQYGLFCEDCGWAVCYFPESAEKGTVCTQCGHTIGTSGACYNYKTSVWNHALIKEIYGE